jgi:hypothetical protein
VTWPKAASGDLGAMGGSIGGFATSDNIIVYALFDSLAAIDCFIIRVIRYLDKVFLYQGCMTQLSQSLSEEIDREGAVVYGWRLDWR